MNESGHFSDKTFKKLYDSLIAKGKACGLKEKQCNEIILNIIKERKGKGNISGAEIIIAATKKFEECLELNRKGN